MAAKRASEAEEDVPELLTWEDDVDGEEEEEDFEDELPADEMMFAGEEDGEGEQGGEESVELEGDDFATKRRAELPQPDRAKSHPDLPRVSSTAFKRIIR